MTLMVVGIATPAAVALTRETDLAQIQAEVEKIRQQTLLEPITPVSLDRVQLRERLISQLRETGFGERLQRGARAQIGLGLMPAGTRVVPLALDGATVGLVGFYDPGRDELVLIGDDDELGAAEEWTYAHEIVHAIQDQRLDLDGLFADRLMASGDTQLAYSALIEGDASLVDQAYLADHPELRLGLLGQAIGVMSNSVGLGGAPPVLVHAGIFPYVDGAVFVRAVRDGGGWLAVDAAYLDPPTSTEQILHPERYLTRDEPTLVDLPDPTRLGSAWTQVHIDTLGELQIAVFLAGQVEPETFAMLPPKASEAAVGWEGDRYALWTDGADEVTVWRSVWENEAEAARFSTGLQGAEGTRLETNWVPDNDDRSALTTEGRTAVIERDGAEVRYVVAPSRQLADRALLAVAR